MKVVVATRVAVDPVLAALKAIEGLQVVHCKEHSEVPQAMAGAEVLVLSDPKGPEGAAIADALRQPGCSVRWIQVTTAGADGLLNNGGVPPGIVVTNQGGAVAPTVAESAMAMILALTRRIPYMAEHAARHEWIKAFDPPLMALETRTLAIVGYGNLGRQLAKRARGFDMKIVGLSRSLASDPLADEMHPMSALHAVLGQADVVAVTVAAFPATRHLMNAAAFAAMKPGSLFVNVSRGETVDQAALRQALVDGRLRGAFIDVTEPEPLPPTDPLWDTPNLLIAPHCAGQGGTRTGARIAKVLNENMALFRAGQPLQHRMETGA
jgi:phosphoglycerate dehydrogenase-like enzyme